MASLLPAVFLLALLSPLLAKELGESKGKDIPLCPSPRGMLSITLTTRSFIIILHFISLKSLVSVTTLELIKKMYLLVCKVHIKNYPMYFTNLIKVNF
jgi:hypothetical protein